MNEQQKKPRVLVICDYYLPGYKSGGGMRTIVNMVERLQDQYEFLIITRDHDGKLDTTPYTSVRINDWNRVGPSKVFYLSKEKVKMSELKRLILEVSPDLLYFNSFFSTLAIYVLNLRRAGRLGGIGVVLAPCGELSEGALQLKSLKKKLFFIYAKILGLYRDIIWKASSDLEKEEIERYKGPGGRILIAPDLPPKSIFPDYSMGLKPEKISGSVKMVFLSRFMRKKNFKWLLEIIDQTQGELEIDIYGPLEDAGYWQECQEIIDRLPARIRIAARGSIPHESVLEVLVKYHFFILPTLGENFGHVFLEALAGGCPLVISDKTPWLELAEKGIGWDLPFETSRWIETIDRCIRMDAAEYAVLSENSRKFLVDWLADPGIEESTKMVLAETKAVSGK